MFVMLCCMAAKLLCDHPSSEHNTKHVACSDLCVSGSPSQVDDRLNGDGTGLPLGINDPALGFIFVGVCGTIWALYFNAQKDFGDFEDDESGLGL